MSSLQHQTFQDHEVLLFDDGSQDRTVDIISETAKRDHRVKLVGVERVGLVDALKRTIGASKAPLIARMDGDDISHPERLARQVAFLDKYPDIAVVSCLVRHFPEERIRGGMARYEAWLNSLVTPDEIARDFFVESPLCHPSVVMRREAYEAVDGYLDDGTPEDYGLWLQLAESGFSFAKVNEVLFYWREGSHRFSRTDSRYHPSRFLELKLRFLKRWYLKGYRAFSIWGAGKLGRRLSRALEQVEINIASFIDIDPKKVGHRVHGALVTPLPNRKNEIGSDIILVAVGNASARQKIRTYLANLGLVELRDFICVA